MVYLNGAAIKLDRFYMTDDGRPMVVFRWAGGELHADARELRADEGWEEIERELRKARDER